MRLRLVAALALAPLLAQAEAPDKQAGVDAWICARAGEYRAWREQTPSPTRQLWRELPPDVEPLPGFVPPTTLAPLIQSVRAGVVNISTSNAGSGASTSTGSGFIISADGHVVTNDHVISRARRIEVRLADGGEFEAEVVGRDSATDVALLRLKGAERSALPVTWLGDSDILLQGDWVVAIGNPFGLDHSVSHGLISAKERVIGIGMFDDFIQTDALINPGNSGGPLFNMRGEVVGVTTAVISQGQGIGFAVPINMVKDLLPNLRQNGRLERGWLGVTIGDTVPEGSDATITVIREVFANGPAASAGLMAGDRVLAVNGRPVESYLQLMRRVAILAPGTETRLTLQRGGSTLEVPVRLGDRPAESLRVAFSEDAIEALGMILRPIDAAGAAARGLKVRSGLLVAGIVPRQSAQRAGINPGDVVTEVNRKPVTDAASLRKVLGGLVANSPVLVRVARADGEQYLALDAP